MKKKIRASKFFNMGFATSSLQEDPFSACFRIVNLEGKQIAKPISNWATWFMKGMNVTLNKAWDEAEKKNNASIVKNLIEKEFQELLDQFSKGGVELQTENNLENGYKQNYIQLDLNLIRQALEELAVGKERGTIFFETLRSVINQSVSNNLDVKIFINQFSDEEIINNYDEELLEEIKINLARLICTSDTTKFVDIQYFKMRSLTDWKIFIDKTIERGVAAYSELKILRVSIEWAEIFPDEDTFDSNAAEKFAEIIRYIKSKDIQVLICLNHMSMPIWIRKGWADRQVLKHHQKFVELLFTYFDGKGVSEMIDRVLVFNEAHTWIPQGYLDGRWPPYSKENWFFGKELTVLLLSSKKLRNFFLDTKLYKTFNNNFYNAWVKSIKAHVIAHRYLKSKYSFKVSSSDIYTGYKAEDNLISTQIAVTMLEKVSYDWFDVMEEIYGHENTYDFIAAQLYATLPLSAKDYGGIKLQRIIDNEKIENKHVNGWLDDPAIFVVRTLQLAKQEVESAIKDERIYLAQLRKISFTEFGTPAGAISARAKFENILHNLNKIKKILPIKFEYMLNWAPFDNWEWDSGYSNWGRFGDLNIDGTPKPELKIYKNYIDWRDTKIIEAASELLSILRIYVERCPSTEDVAKLERKIINLEKFVG